MIVQSRHHRWVFYLLLLAGLFFGQRPVLSQTQTNSLPFEREIRAFEKADLTNPPPKNAILFVGSSSIRRWKTLKDDFPDKPVFNRGFGGSEISDSVFYADRIVIPYRPRLIVFYAGTNDINAGKKPRQLLEDFEAFVEKVHHALPDTRIDYISIAPSPSRWQEVDQVKEANQLIADYIHTDKTLTFIDVFSSMLGPDGMPGDIYVSDKLHLNAKGYAIWTKIIAPYLD